MAATRPDLRVGDTERDSTATSLREHYAQGRLSTGELNERLDAAFSATTQGQLEQVTRDLPHIQPAPSATAPPSAAVPRRRPGRGAAKALILLAALIALLVVVAAGHGLAGNHVPRTIAELIVGLLILRALAGRVFGHHHHRDHQHWDHHEHHRSRSGHGYSYNYRYEYNYEPPRESR